jgi:uncharacterized repeat protein (TIGR02543 family)
LAVVLAAVLMCGAGAVGVVPAAAANYQTGDLIYFGSYPQSEVTDTALITALNGLSGASVPNSNGCTMSDITYNGEKYRKVVRSGAVNGYSAGVAYFFKYEPIQWRVLSNDEQGLFVVAEATLDALYFSGSSSVNIGNGQYDGYLWVNSNVRTWLNSDFYNAAFTTSQQSNVKTSSISTSGFSNWQGGPDTQDKVFLLDRSEVLNSAYGFTTTTAANAVRESKATSYAKIRSVSHSITTTGNAVWWLRSAGYGSGNFISPASFVYDNGYVYSYLNTVGSGMLGVRPALRLGELTTTYTITYNANGGTGAPASQTKTQGVALTLSSDTIPTRTGFTFKGWSTTNTATTAQFQPGSNYTTDASVTLHAVWKAPGGKRTIAQLRADYPASVNGQPTYWNHRETTTVHNIPEHYTLFPCAHLNTEADGERDGIKYPQATYDCNGHVQNGEERLWQCKGFAAQLGYEFSGTRPGGGRTTGDWERKTGTEAASYFKSSSLKPGDIVNYKISDTWYHSIFVVSVSTSSITFADCNYGNNCNIRWDETMNKSDISDSQLTGEWRENGVLRDYGYILVAPTAGSDVNKTALSNRINELKSTVNNNYTATSWQAFQSALNNAQAILEKSNATQTEIDNAVTTLNAAFSGLQQNQPEPTKGIFGTKPRWTGEWWHYILYVLFGFVWMYIF